jgi:MoaA/NifB/PqqE/SkfB family radical SAM enzyme
MANALQQELVRIDLTDSPKRVSRISTSFTTRCNLRCTYCPEGSHPESFYGDMTPGLLDHIVDYAKANRVHIDVSYYGDSAFHERFGEFAAKIHEAGVGLAITSNFARLLGDDEIAAVARCKTVSFSFDTDDRDKARAIRKGLDLRTLVYNILRVRAFCLIEAIPVPPFTLHVVLNDQTVNDLPRLVAFAASLGVNQIGCNELAEIEGATGKMVNVSALSGEALRKAIASIDQAAALAIRLGIPLTASGEHLSRIGAAVAGTLKKDPVREAREGIQGTYYFSGGDDALELKPGMTRACLEPWVGPIVDPKGDVYSCCARGTSMGVVGRDGSLSDVHNNNSFRALRRSLLTGKDLVLECRRCHIASQTTPAELQQKVVELFV